MLDLATLQALLAPLLPGLMGVRLLQVSPERVRAEMTVRPDLCTAGHRLHGGSFMAFADTLGAVGTVLFGIVLFEEPTTVGRLVCVGLIVAGIVGLKLTGSAG